MVALLSHRLPALVVAAILAFPAGLFVSGTTGPSCGCGMSPCCCQSVRAVQGSSCGLSKCRIRKDGRMPSVPERGSDLKGRFARLVPTARLPLPTAAGPLLLAPGAAPAVLAPSPPTPPPRTSPFAS